MRRHTERKSRCRATANATRTMAKIYNDISGEPEQASQSMKGYDHTRFSNDRRYMQLVLLAAQHYDNISDLRKKCMRDIDYSMG